ncbi:sensor histidine kinase [Paenibacillus thailandensis]|uniref:Sensor histidine kinase n=1 Tax=Paenibacillus thailandensis TaxID=393250 RepID=A0ABW5R1K8_9BACL
MNFLIKKTAELFSNVAKTVSRRLVNKLLLLFMSIIVLVVGLLTAISYQMLQNESIQSNISSASSNLKLVNRNLHSYLSDMEQFSLPQNSYDELTYAILHQNEDYSSRMYVEDYLKGLFYARDDLAAIYMYVIDQHSYYAVTKEHYNVTVRKVLDADFEGYGWYKETLQNPKNRSYQPLAGPSAGGELIGYPVDPDTGFMAYHWVMRSIVTRKPQAVFSFYYTNQMFDQMIGDVPLNGEEHLMYFSPDGRLFYADDYGFYGQAAEEGMLQRLDSEDGGHFTWGEGDRKYLVVYDVEEAEGWRLVKPIPYGQIREAATTNRNIALALGIGFLLIAIVTVFFYSKAITRPLNELQKQMKRFSAGDFEAQSEVKGRDEIAYLSHHFNLMVKRTNELITERYKMKLAEKNAILKALEAEINPHFLYNALQAISTKALRYERYDIADMVDALALTLRYCISGRDIVLAREELQHIERYMSLQKARFGARLQVVYEWDEPLMDVELPKLSVQTLAENAIKHALEKVSSTVTITIGAKLAGEHTVITVADDGPGFEPDRLKKVLLSFEEDWQDRETDNVGLLNLHTRLRLLYGEKASLHIHSDKSGTRMEMLLPQGGHGKDVQRIDH